MLKKLVKPKNLLSQEDIEILAKFEILNRNPLSCFETEYNIKDFYSEQNAAIKILKKYSIDELFAFLVGQNIENALYSLDGDIFTTPSKTLTIAGNVLELVEQSNKATGNGIIKIDKNHYIKSYSPIHPNNLEKGDDPGEKVEGFIYREGFYYQLFEYETKGQKSANELRKTFRRLSYIINANTENPSNCLWVTLTYAENIKGADGNKKLYHDFELGIKKLRRKYGKFEYISVVEPQGRGAWHCHCIFIFSKKAPYIPNKEIQLAWGQGFTKTKAMDSNCDNLGAYLTAYLCDIPLDDSKGLFTIEEAEDIVNSCPIVEKDGKKFIKGGRLYLYPPFMKIYRTSRGVKQPEIIKNITDAELQEKIENLPILYQTMYELSLEEKSAYKNVIRYTQYNKTVKTEEEVILRKNKLRNRCREN